MIIIEINKFRFIKGFSIVCLIKLIEKDKQFILIWNNNERIFRIQSNLDRNTIIKIANNLEKNKKFQIRCKKSSS